MDFLFKAIFGELYEEIFSVKKPAEKQTNNSKVLEEIVKSEFRDIRSSVNSMNERLNNLSDRIDCIDDLLLEGNDNDFESIVKRVVDLHKIVTENRNMINELYTIQEMMAKLALPQAPTTQKKQQDPYRLPSIKKNDDKDKLN